MDTFAYIVDVEKLKDEALFKKYYSMMPKYRKEKIDAIKPEGSKRLSLGAGIALMNALSAFNVSEADAGKIGYGENGKPYLCNCPKVFFSLSHSGHYAFCVVDNTEVGCDVEMIKENRDINGVTDRYLSDKEKEYVRKDKKRFFKLWTFKESYIKATGKGLSTPLDSFSVFLNEKGDFEKLIVENKENKDYSFLSIEDFEDAFFTICRKGKAVKVTVKMGDL